MGRRALGPGAPFDHVLVGAVLDGRTVRGRLASGDVWEITRQLAIRGFSDGQIAYRTGYGRRQILRIRQGLDIPALCYGTNQQTRPIHDEPSVGKR